MLPFQNDGCPRHFITETNYQLCFNQQVKTKQKKYVYNFHKIANCEQLGLPSIETGDKSIHTANLLYHFLLY